MDILDEWELKRIVSLNMTAAFISGVFIGAAIVCRQMGYQDAAMWLWLIATVICLLMRFAQ